MPEQPEVIWHPTRILPEDRAAALGQRPVVVWLTGLSGSGKSTLANALEQALHQRGHHSFLLDGDNIRHGLNHDLDLSPQGRRENIRRIGEVTRLLLDAGLIVVTAFISPYREDRQQVRETVGPERFFEVHVRATLATCEQRDPKGLYARARRGEIQYMTGIDDPYEAPDDPDLIIDTDRDSVETATEHLLQALRQRGAI
ncbi:MULTISPECIES: adenylyl-sulfate kinase [unclassified Halorhodospira]|uniref:adenylyl-sulfate kinase n=1 Tax=unclassified Halorhodospira TaxID=2626748 RepID=UPI001EE99DA6|nr:MULTISPECIES: adenylyl-sulfate kinase [unclassified Halorhodospira]MCG5540658.1 adenylyl-sulfate kinase [Halorhodospira sp. M39old]MCG5546779.1 adenylyl-sulfate kinase [Halorhodospira sp. M38]